MNKGNINIYDLVEGAIGHQRVVSPLGVGSVHLREEDDHYLLKFKPFYIVKNKNTQAHYDVFSKKIQDAEVSFEKKVGEGKLKKGLRQYMEIKLFEPKITLFMCLHPKVKRF